MGVQIESIITWEKVEEKSSRKNKIRYWEILGEKKGWGDELWRN